MSASPRSGAKRREDALAQLTTPGIDVWVASAAAGDEDGAAQAHLVPLSLAWIDDRVVVAVEIGSRTARNVRAQQAARLAVGPTRDVVMIDAALDGVTAVGEAPAHLADRYADLTGWDPRNARVGDYAFLVLRPERVQAWREADEIEGRTLMRSGRWLV